MNEALDGHDGRKTLRTIELEDKAEYVNWISYGSSGSGKSTALAHAADLGRVLVIDAEGGLKKSALKRQGVNTNNLHIFTPESGRLTVNDLLAVHEEILIDLDNKPGSWFAVIIDSLTDLTATLVENAIDNRVKLTGGKANPDFTDLRDYGVMTTQMRRVIRRFRDLPCHFLCTALEKFGEDLKERSPAITPKLLNDLMGYTDILTYHRSDSGVYRALTQRTETTHAKDRFGILPKVLYEPDFPRLLAYVRGELEESTDTVQQRAVENMKESK